MNNGKGLGLLTLKACYHQLTKALKRENQAKLQIRIGFALFFLPSERGISLSPQRKTRCSSGQKAVDWVGSLHLLVEKCR